MVEAKLQTESEEEEEEEEEESEVVAAPKKTGTAGMFKVSGGPATVQQEGTSEFKTTAGEIQSSSSSHFESSSAATKTESAPAPVPASAAKTEHKHVEEVSTTSKVEHKSETASSAQAAPVPQPEKKQEAAPVPQPPKPKAPVSDEEEEEEESEVTPPKSKPAAPKAVPEKAPEPAPVQMPKPAAPAPARPQPGTAPPAKPAPSATAQSVVQEGGHAADAPMPSKIKQDQQGLFTQDAQQVLLPAPTPTHHSIKEFAPKMEVEGPHKGHPEHAFSKAGKEQVSHIRSEWGVEKENERPSEGKVKVKLQDFSPYTHDTTAIPTGEAVFAKSGVGKLASDWPPPPSGVPRTSIFGDAKKRTKLFDEASWIHGDHYGAGGGSAPWGQSAGKLGSVWPPPESPIVRQEVAPTIIRTEEIWHPEEGSVQRSWPGGQVPVRMQHRQWPPPTPEEIYQMQLEQYRQQQDQQALQQQQQQQIPAQGAGRRSGK